MNLMALSDSGFFISDFLSCSWVTRTLMANWIGDADQVILFISYTMGVSHPQELSPRRPFSYSVISRIACCSISTDILPLDLSMESSQE